MDGVWTASGALAAAAAGFAGWSVRGRASSIFGDSVYHGDRARSVIALTFDDGPSESTPALLAVLQKHNVRATFFMCGANVRRCPEIAVEIQRRGHEIGNHSDTHPVLCFKSQALIRTELARAQEAIQQVTGATPRWFRAPYGVRWFGMGAAQRQLGLTGVMWTMIARDWRLPAPGIEQRMAAGAASGAIFCLHDGRGIRPRPNIRPTIDAVDHAIPRLLDRGFRFETLSEVLNRL